MKLLDVSLSACLSTCDETGKRIPAQINQALLGSTPTLVGYLVCHLLRGYLQNLLRESAHNINLTFLCRHFFGRNVQGVFNCSGSSKNLRQVFKRIRKFRQEAKAQPPGSRRKRSRRDYVSTSFRAGASHKSLPALCVHGKFGVRAVFEFLGDFFNLIDVVTIFTVFAQVYLHPSFGMVLK